MNEFCLTGKKLTEWMAAAPVGSRIHSTITPAYWIKTAEARWGMPNLTPELTPIMWESSIIPWICIPNYTVEEEWDDC